MREPIFGAPKRLPGHDPYGRLLKDYCLADNKAISCTGDERTLRPFVERVASAFGIKAVSWNCQPEIGLTINGKHVRLDLLIADAEGRRLDVESQKSDESNLLDRLTYYTSSLLYDHLASGKKYGDLKDVYLVFVCKGDHLGTGKAVDIMEMAHMPEGKIVGAKFHWAVLSRDRLSEPENDLEWLLYDFFCNDATKIHSPEMAERLKYLQSEEGCNMMYETREEEIERKTKEAEAKGIAKKAEEDVLGMLNEGIPIDVIARVAKIGVDDVRAIAYRHGVKLL